MPIFLFIGTFPSERLHVFIATYWSPRYPIIFFSINDRNLHGTVCMFPDHDMTARKTPTLSSFFSQTL